MRMLSTLCQVAIPFTVAVPLPAQPRVATPPKIVVPDNAPKVESTSRTRSGDTALQIPKASAGQVTLLSRKSTGWSSDQAPKITAGAGNPQIVLAPNEQLIIKPKTTAAQLATMPLSAEKRALPGLLIAAPEPGQTSVRILRLFLQARHVPLHWDEKLGAYSTVLIVGLDDEQGKPGGASLPSTITIELIGTNLRAITPARVTIEKTGTNGYREVTIAADHYDSEIEVSAHSDLGDQRFKSSVNPGFELAVIASQERVLGFGLDSTHITVTRFAANGQQLSDPRSLAVTLATNRGNLATPSLTIPERAASASTLLYSTGSGAAEIRASAARGSSRVSVDFVVPWLHLFAAVAGALIGGALQLAYKKRFQHWKRGLLIAVAVGIVVDLTMATGLLVSLLPTTIIRTELGWFVIGALSGFIGVELVARLAAFVFKPLSAVKSGS